METFAFKNSVFKDKFVVSLPMRDGNGNRTFRISIVRLVVSLPMRDGNKIDSSIT